MNEGVFVCSCADTCSIDLAETRDRIQDAEVAASSRLLCQDGLGAYEQVLEEYDLDELVITCPERSMQRRLTAVAEDHGIDETGVQFVDQREGAGWVHDTEAATEKTARLIEGARASKQVPSQPRKTVHQAGYDVAVVGDPDTAAALAESADVTLIADGEEFADADADLEAVSLERGRVVDVDGAYGEFELTLRARVTEDCISCMKCVYEGPDGMVTRRPVDIDPEAPPGEWTDVCPTDAIDLGGVERTIECDQVIYPGGTDGTVGGRRGFHTGPIDAKTVDEVQRLLGGFESPSFLDLEMEVCAAGEFGEEGCTECVDACPHGAVDRPAVDEVNFRLDSCRNCGACTSACPTGATMLQEPGNERIAREVEALLAPTADEGGLVDRLLGSAADIETPVVAFVCSERAQDALRKYGRLAASGRVDIEYPPILPVNVNCTDTVGEAHVLHALAAGVSGVAVVGCGGSCLHSGPDPKAELVSRLNRATTDLGLGDRVTFVAPDPETPGAFVEELSKFVVNDLDASPIPTGEHVATGKIDDPGRGNPAFDTHGWSLESVRTILEHVDPERDRIRGLESFGVVEVGDGCTLTPTCSRFCPTDALRRTDDGLEFNHERCVNCGLCEEVCVEDVMTVESGLDLSLLPERSESSEPAWTLVNEGSMLTCAGCGMEFASEATVDAVEERVGEVVSDLAPEGGESIFHYCPDCRTALLYDPE